MGIMMAAVMSSGPGCDPDVESLEGDDIDLDRAVAVPAGIADISRQALIDATSLPHHVSPTTSVPASYCQSRSGTPTTYVHPNQSCAKNNNFSRERYANATSFNPWILIASLADGNGVRQELQLGEMQIAIKRGGSWTTEAFGAPVQAFNFATGPVDNRTVTDIARPSGGYSYLGVGTGKWQDRNDHAHGWPGPHWHTNTNGIQAMVAWMPGRITDNRTTASAVQQIAIGVDLRNASTGTGLPAAIRGRQLPLGTSWSWVFAHDRTRDEVISACDQGDWPEGFPVAAVCRGGDAEPDAPAPPADASWSTLAHRSSGLNLHASENAEDETVIADYTGRRSQWSLVAEEDGWSNIQHLASGLFLHASEATPEDVVLSPYTGRRSQWRLVDAEPGWALLEHRASGLYLHVNENDPELVRLDVYTGARSQWALSAVE